MLERLCKMYPNQKSSLESAAQYYWSKAQDSVFVNVSREFQMHISGWELLECY